VGVVPCADLVLRYVTRKKAVQLQSSFTYFRRSERCRVQGMSSSQLSCKPNSTGYVPIRTGARPASGDAP